MSTRRAPAVLTGALLAAVLLYVLAGELLQVWVGLHMDAWSERASFGSERDRTEWQRVRNALDVASRGWPWKTSLLIDSARVDLFGDYAGFVPPQRAGAQVLDALARAKARRLEDGEMLALEMRGQLLRNDVDGARAAMLRLQRAAPQARAYWQPLVMTLCEYALGEPGFQPLAREAVAYYAGWDGPQLAGMVQQQPAVAAFLAAAAPATKP